MSVRGRQVQSKSTEGVGPQCPPPRPELEGLWWVPLSLELQLYMAYTLSMVYEGHSVRDKTKIMWRCHVCVCLYVFTNVGQYHDLHGVYHKPY